MTNRLSIAQVYNLALDAGFTPAQAKVMTAIAIGESGLDADNVGDQGLQTSKWGPSIGLWQIRSLKAESGKGTPRDATRLTDPVFNAKAAYTVWRDAGKSYRPWTIFTNGSYAGNLDKVAAVVHGATYTIPGILPAPRPARGAGAPISPAGWSPSDIPGEAAGAAGAAAGALLNPAGAIVDAVGGAIGSAFGAVMDRIVKAAAPVGFKVAGGLMGATLVVYGVKRLVDPAVQKARSGAVDAAALAAAPETGGASLAAAGAVT